MARRARVTGWKLPESERELLFCYFPPKYEKVIADHVTLKVHSSAEAQLPEIPRSSRVVGRADDGRGVECLVVELNGSTDRPDGSTYHITWSLRPGRTARESNDVLRNRPWVHLQGPIPIELIPARF